MCSRACFSSHAISIHHICKYWLFGWIETDVVREKENCRVGSARRNTWSCPLPSRLLFWGGLIISRLISALIDVQRCEIFSQNSLGVSLNDSIKINPAVGSIRCRLERTTPSSLLAFWCSIHQLGLAIRRWWYPSDPSITLNETPTVANRANLILYVSIRYQPTPCWLDTPIRTL